MNKRYQANISTALIQQAKGLKLQAASLSGVQQSLKPEASSLQPLVSWQEMFGPNEKVDNHASNGN